VKPGWQLDAACADAKSHASLAREERWRRREFIAVLGSAATAWPLGVRAQQATKTYRIGFVDLPSAGSLPERPEDFRAGLRDLGYQERLNLFIECRWAEGRYERMPALFAELVRLNVDVIVTHGTLGVRPRA
jgi:putative tryptophan/tyrosine transport system substrate-binding protein